MKHLRFLLFAPALFILASIGEFTLAILGSVIFPPTNGPIDYDAFDDDPSTDVNASPDADA